MAPTTECVLRTLLALSVTLSLLACVGVSATLQQPTVSRAPQDLRQLNDSEIAAAIEGRFRVITRDPETRRAMIIETYCRGRVTVLGTRVPMYGTYSVHDGALCTSFVQAGESCERIYVDQAGRYLRGDIDASRQSAPRPIELVELNCGQ